MYGLVAGAAITLAACAVVSIGWLAANTLTTRGRNASARSGLRGGGAADRISADSVAYWDRAASLRRADAYDDGARKGTKPHAGF